MKMTIGRVSALAIALLAQITITQAQPVKEDFRGLTLGMNLESASKAAAANGGACDDGFGRQDTTSGQVSCSFPDNARATLYLSKKQRAYTLRVVFFKNIDADEFTQNIIASYSLQPFKDDLYKTPSGHMVQIHAGRPENSSFDIVAIDILNEDSQVPLSPVPKL